MATAKTTSSRAKAAPAADDSSKAIAALEAKVKSLEASLAECKACCEAAAAPSAGGLSADDSRRLNALWSFCRRLGMR
jgi:hypothetical protein